MFDYQLPQWDAFHEYINMTLINSGTVMVTERLIERACTP